MYFKLLYFKVGKIFIDLTQWVKKYRIVLIKRTLSYQDLLFSFQIMRVGEWEKKKDVDSVEKL